MNRLTQQLNKTGLRASEITLYLYLLQNGISTPPQLSEGTGIARTNCYHLLGSLKEKGLIQSQFKGKRKAYIARDPQALVTSLEEKKEAIEELLPDLRALYATQKNKPKIRFYEGLDEVREIYWQSLEAEEIKALGSTEQLSRLDNALFIRYQKEIKKRDIVFYDILTPASGEKVMKQSREILKGLYAGLVLPARYNDIPTDILIWKDNIALITLKDPIFGTVLTNPLLAQTFRTIFDFIWQTLNEK